MDNKEQNERLKNYLLFKMYNTNDEMSEFMPIHLKGLGIVVIILIVMVLVNVIF